MARGKGNIVVPSWMRKPLAQRPAQLIKPGSWPKSGPPNPDDLETTVTARVRLVIAIPCV